MRDSVRRIVVCAIVLVAIRPSAAQELISRGAVVLSHVSPEYDQASDECVVLFNASGDTLDLFGYEIRYYTASGATGHAVHIFDTSRILRPSAHLLLASNDTVTVGSVHIARDLPLSPGMASSGGQLELRHRTVTDSVIYAVAWGTVTGFVSGMTDAATWNGDGILSLVNDGMKYLRSSYTSSNLEYLHTPADSVLFLPSGGTIPVYAVSAWQIRLRVTQNGSRDTMIAVGMDAAATDDFDPGFDLPKPPPPPGNSITAGVRRADLGLSTGPYLARDFRQAISLADTNARWIIDIFPASTVSPVVLIGEITGLNETIPVIARDLMTDVRHERTGDSILITIDPPISDPHSILLSIGDTTPPLVSFLSPGAGEMYTVGDEVLIQISAADKSGIDSVHVLFEDLIAQDLIGIDGPADTLRSFIWDLPRRLISDSARFRVFARDSMGNHAESWSDIFAVLPDTIRRYFPAGWHLFSVPLDPIARSIEDILPQAQAESAYVFAYNPVSGYTPADTLEPGTGYFLGTLNGRMLSIAGRPAPEALERSTSPGFVLVSHSAPEAITVASLEILRDGIGKSYAEAVSAGLIGIGVLGYDPISMSYFQTDSLYPWHGYWIPVLDSGITIRTAPYFGGMPERVLRPRSEGWTVRLLFTTNGRRDSLLTLGVDPSASEGFDPVFDAPAPPDPPISSSARVWFDHPEWNVSTGSRFLSDMRGPGVPPEWTVILRSPVEIDGLLEWRVTSGILPGDLTLVDIVSGRQVQMRDTDRITVSGGRERTFQIRSSISRIAPRVEDAETFSVDLPYPNPFNGQISLSLYLPERSSVAVVVTDIVGRKVGTVGPVLLERGRRVLRWTTELPSGTYFCRVDARNIEDGRYWRGQLKVMHLR